MMTKFEIDIQISLGTMVTAPKEIAKIIQQTTDPKAVIWGLNHKNTKVRQAAVKNPNLPVGDLVCACVTETSKLVRESIERAVERRFEEVEEVLDLIKDFPQLNIPGIK